MDEQNFQPNRTYIKSNAVTVMHFLWFVTALMLVLVVGFCIFAVVDSGKNSQYHWDVNGKFYYTLDNRQATIVKFMDADAKTYEIPRSVSFNGKNYPVTVIGAHAFANHRKLTSVVIPDNVTEVLGDSKTQTGAFSGCLALATIDFGHGMMRIGKYAFKNCLALSAVNFPASVQFIEDGAFQGCLALESIELNSNGILGVDCFADCTNVTILKLADNVRLTDSACQVLSDLAKLSTFLLT